MGSGKMDEKAAKRIAAARGKKVRPARPASQPASPHPRRFGRRWLSLRHLPSQTDVTREREREKKGENTNQNRIRLPSAQTSPLGTIGIEKQHGGAAAAAAAGAAVA